MSAREAHQWREFMRQHPIDDESVHHAQLALLTSIYVNAHLPKGVKRMQTTDFLLCRQKQGEEAPDLDTKFRIAFARMTKTGPA